MIVINDSGSQKRSSSPSGMSGDTAELVAGLSGGNISRGESSAFEILHKGA